MNRKVRDRKVLIEKPTKQVSDTGLTLVPLRNFRVDDEPELKCEWCGSMKNLMPFAMNTYDFKPKEKLIICRKCEMQARKIGKGAFHFDSRWIDAIKALRARENAGANITEIVSSISGGA